MIAEVLVEISSKNIDRVFDYIIPERLQNNIQIGIRVTVPFGHQILEGFVLNIKNKIEISEMKEIIDIVDDDIVLNDELLELGKKMQKDTLATLISCYQVMLPKALKASNGTVVPKKMLKIIELNIDNSDIPSYTFNEKQKIIIDTVLKNKKVNKIELNKISISALKTLLNKKILKETIEEVYRFETKGSAEIFKYPLTAEQSKVVNTILKDNGKEVTYLLHGVTGSGKTEVYMELIENMLKQGKSSIVLVPEISLTPQLVERFKKRFAENIAILHYPKVKNMMNIVRLLVVK